MRQSLNVCYFAVASRFDKSYPQKKFVLEEFSNLSKNENMSKVWQILNDLQ